MNTTTSESLKKRIRIASGAEPADYVIKNCRIVNVFTHEIQEGDIAFCDKVIAAIGSYSGRVEVDAKEMYALPGFLDAHIHIESSFLTPEEFGRVSVPHGTTTILADPHEIANVCGLDGIEYMLKAGKSTALNIRYMVPSCVPCTEWEDAGATLDAEDMRSLLHRDCVGGIAEFMDNYGVLNTNDPVIDKLVMAYQEDVHVDGHSPGIAGLPLAGYLTTGIRTDHECGTVEEMTERLRAGVYVLLRYGSACHELPLLIKGLTPENSRRCCLCSDDRHSATLLKDGEIDDCLRVCVKNGVDPITAVQMATLNTAECFGLKYRGAIAPGRFADIVLVNNLTDFAVDKVWIEGRLCAEGGKYLLPTTRVPLDKVGDTVHVKDFSVDRLRLNLKTNRVNAIDITPGTVLSAHSVVEIKRTPSNDFLFDKDIGVARISVIERHKRTGNVANGFLRGYGLSQGAIAISVGHDSHNIVTVGVSAEEMAVAVEKLIEMKGGIAVVLNGEVLHTLPLPVAGLMSDQTAEFVRDELAAIQDIAHNKLGVNPKLDAMIGLVALALPVIPDLRITDRGMFSVTKQAFIPPEAE